MVGATDLKARASTSEVLADCNYVISEYARL
jgi:hypothetical protein